MWLVTVPFFWTHCSVFSLHLIPCSPPLSPPAAFQNFLCCLISLLLFSVSSLLILTCAAFLQPLTFHVPVFSFVWLNVFEQLTPAFLIPPDLYPLPTLLNWKRAQILPHLSHFKFFPLHWTRPPRFPSPYFVFFGRHHGYHTLPSLSLPSLSCFFPLPDIMSYCTLRKCLSTLPVESDLLLDSSGSNCAIYLHNLANCLFPKAEKSMFLPWWWL